MINQFIQNILYHFILSETTLAMKIEPGFFDAKNLQICFQYARDYVIKYHEAPSANQLKEIIHSTEYAQTVTDDIIDIIYAQQSSVNDYSYEWLYDTATTWGSWENFVTTLKNTIAYVQMNKDSVTVENVKEIMEHAKGLFNKTAILEFGDSDKSGSDFWDAASHKQKKMKRSTSGYKYIDACLKGGYFPGCLICFVGAPKVGKSLWMQNLCAESVKRGEDCAYVSLELPEEMINFRIGSNMFNIPSLEYEKYSDDEEAFAERIQAFRRSCLVAPGQLVVKEFPTSTLSTVDLEAWLLEEEERRSTPDRPFKFKNVFVDYINIMKNWRNPNTENTYMKIKQIAEDLRAIGAKNKWAIITATQTNRTQFDTNDMNASQVSESSALGATVDAMFGIIADPMMQLNGEYYLKCIYDRVAPEANTKKRFLNDREHLRITEDELSPTENVMSTFTTGATPQINGHRKNSQQSAEVQQQAIQSAPGAGFENTSFELHSTLMTDSSAPQTRMSGVGSYYPQITGMGMFQK